MILRHIVKERKRDEGTIQWFAKGYPERGGSIAVSPYQGAHCGESAENRCNPFTPKEFWPTGRGFPNSL